MSAEQAKTPTSIELPLFSNICEFPKKDYKTNSNIMAMITQTILSAHNGVKLEISNNKMVRKCPKNYLEMNTLLNQGMSKRRNHKRN